MTIYVKIALADERFCDGCPCLDAGHFCRTMNEVIHERRPPFTRPQACIKASMDIRDDVDLALAVRAQDRQEAKEQACYVDGKRVPPGGLADALAEAEEASE